MASADVRKELLDCSVCLNIYTDPVTLRCGHNFCRVCIDQVLDTQDVSGVYSCPECRAESAERPVLIRNITLCNIVESFCSAQPAQEQTGILCTYCMDSPVPAVKSCLMCEASLCDKHLRIHSKAPDHILTEPATSLGNRKCSIHKELLKYYCMEDSACVCVSCRLDGEHQGHQVEVLDKASENKKKKLSNILQELVKTREETERRIQSLQEHRGEIPGMANDVKEIVSALVMDITKQLGELVVRVLSDISWQEEQTLRSLSDIIQHLELKKDELSKKICHIEEVCKMTDPLTVLRELDTGDLCNTKKGDEDRKTHNKQLKSRGELDMTLISQTLHKLSEIVSGVKRGVYVQEPADILLDVNTAGNCLQISDNMKTASFSKCQKYPETAERFMHPQVLSITSFTSGRYSWEVEIKGSNDWIAGMCYASMDKKGYLTVVGRNNRSWGLDRKAKYSAVHNKKETQLPDNIISNRFRISLDYEGGQLSFYELCEPVRHLHTFTATFTEPLHAVLGVWQGSVKIIGLEMEKGLFCK